MATSPTQKPWVNIAVRLIPLLTALGLVLGFAALCDHVPNAPQTVSPADFVNAHTNDANSVVASVQTVNTAMPRCDARIAGAPLQQQLSDANRAPLQQQLSDANASFEEVRGKLRLSAPNSNPPTGHERAYDEMKTAVERLSSAVSTAKSFVDSQKPSELENFTSEWNDARAQWNHAVTEIWMAAGQAGQPPLVDTAAVGCR